MSRCGACGLYHDLKISCELAKKESEISREFFKQYIPDHPPCLDCGGTKVDVGYPDQSHLCPTCQDTGVKGGSL